ncbi:MAG TPA: hypothetical protein VL156_09795 [Terriglobales bacterium]|jgi:hypothetical protein|nr:hypothetical protein [Terriglobales bacterium]
MLFANKIYQYLALAAAILIPSSCLAQSGDWNVVHQLSANQAIKVTLDDGRSYHGNFHSATETDLVIHAGEDERTLLRNNIRGVAIRSHSHRGRNALIGAGIGAGVGLGAGVSIDNDCSKTSIVCTGNKGKAILTPAFAFLGAGIGALLPSGGWHEIYRSR